MNDQRSQLARNAPLELTEKLISEIEYQVDDEDEAWLNRRNSVRAKSGFNRVTLPTVELLMDRLEKESHFNATRIFNQTQECCICLSKDYYENNNLLNCFMCNIIVHQDCYGVPHIGNNKWFCLHCSMSPSILLRCDLCPNTFGAFKRTSRDRWAHVNCAIWIPEVRFANPTYLEPITAIENIPEVRWSSECSICQLKYGVCIKCSFEGCSISFHVTCAQLAGFIVLRNSGGVKIDIKDLTTAVYCHAHSPNNKYKDIDLGEIQARVRKQLSLKPLLFEPEILPQKIKKISALVEIDDKFYFIERLLGYWTFKRQTRKGVHLIPRLLDNCKIMRYSSEVLPISDEDDVQEEKPRFKRKKLT